MSATAHEGADSSQSRTVYEFDFRELTTKPLNHRPTASNNDAARIYASNHAEILAASHISLGNMNALCTALCQQDVEFSTRREAAEWLMSAAEEAARATEAVEVEPLISPVEEVDEPAPPASEPIEKPPALSQPEVVERPSGYARHRILESRLLKYNPEGKAAKPLSKMAASMAYIKSFPDGVLYEAYKGAGFKEQEAKLAFTSGMIFLIDPETNTVLNPRDWRQWVTPRVTEKPSDNSARRPAGRRSIFAGKLLRPAEGLPGNPRRPHAKGRAAMDYILSHPEGVSYEHFIAQGFRRVDLASDYRRGYVDVMPQEAKSG